MNGYLLDTVTLSEGTRSVANRGVAAWLTRTDISAMYLSVLTVGEIQRGIDRLDTATKRRRELERWLVYELIGRFGGRILNFELETARLWGSMVAWSMNHGRPLPVLDSQLAATARMHALTIVTRNEKHFAAFGVATLNPWS